MKLKNKILVGSLFIIMGIGGFVAREDASKWHYAGTGIFIGLGAGMLARALKEKN